MRRSQVAVHQGEASQGTSWSHGTSWSFTGVAGRALALAVAVLLGSALVAAPAQQRAAAEATQAVADGATQIVRVIIRTVEGTGEVERSVEQRGGTVVDHIDLIGGIVVDLDEKLVPFITATPGVVSVSFDRPVRTLSRQAEGDAIAGAAALAHVRKVTGATVSDRRGFDGSGIGVAVVDTGAASVPGLPNLLHGPDLGGGTSEDGWGHGTHLAGIIAGNDQGLTADNFLGVASDSSVVSVKAAADDGTTNLSSVLASLDWVLEQRTEKNIRVLNLSLGVAPQSDYRYDILAYAVERLWSAGIVVVVAAGNDGEKAGSPLTSPATDPYVIAVGSVNTQDSDTTSDDVVQPFSPRGSADRRVDLVAPGQSIVSLRAPGSYAELNFPAAFVGDRFIKGTGTSQAAAVVSAIAADLVEQRPDLTPDQVKALLRVSATRLSGTDSDGQGAGLINLKLALATLTPSNATQTWEPATGPVPAAPQDPPPAPPADGDPYCEYDVTLGPPAPPALEGEDPATGMCGWTGGSWSTDGSTYTGGSWSGGSWSGGSWSGGSWSGGSWSGGSWSGGSWSGGSWSGGSWSVGTWTGGSWSGGLWSGGSWSGETFSGGSWSGGSWSGGSWSGGSWSGGSWSGGSWSGGSWSGVSWSGGSWSGGSWSGGSWSGGSWSGGSWSGGSWSGGSWSGGSWSGGSWSGGSWSGGSWSGGSWSGGSWSGGSWSGGSWSGGSWSGGSWSGGSWSGGSWSGGSWSGDAWTGTSWS